MISAQSAKVGPQAINASIELISLSEQKAAAIRISKSVSFDAKAVDALLKAA